jgi:cell division protein FtsA
MRKRMPKNDIIVGLDIGSTMIRTVVGQIRSESEKPHIIGIGMAPSQGIVKGAVVDVDETVSAISSSLEEAERITGIAIENAHVAIGGNHIESQNSRGVIAVSRADGEITEDDVARVIEAAQAVSLPTNQEILHIIPKAFTVDDQQGIKDPVGMNGIRLEVEANIIGGSTSLMKNLTKCITRTGIEINEAILSPLAAASAVLTKRQKELGAALIDIGGATTGLSVFVDGDLTHVAVLPVGSDHITNDIAIGLRTSIDVAEKVKIEYGFCVPDEVSEDEQIDLSKIDPHEEDLVSRYHVAQIIEARFHEIFEMIDAELAKVNLSGMLPAGVMLTGGGAKLPGLVDVAKDKLRLPAQIGFPIDLPVSVKKIDDPSFATGIGLILWATDARARIGDFVMYGHGNGRNGVGNTVGKMKRWFQSFMP